MAVVVPEGVVEALVVVVVLEVVAEVVQDINSLSKSFYYPSLTALSVAEAFFLASSFDRKFSQKNLLSFTKFV